MKTAKLAVAAVPAVLPSLSAVVVSTFLAMSPAHAQFCAFIQPVDQPGYTEGVWGDVTVDPDICFLSAGGWLVNDGVNFNFATGWDYCYENDELINYTNTPTTYYYLEMVICLRHASLGDAYVTVVVDRTEWDFLAFAW